MTIETLLQHIPASIRNAMPHRLQRIVKLVLQKQRLKQWDGKTTPPPHLAKVKLIKQFAKTHQLNTLIETGTYMGDMVDSVKSDFKTIYSIELSPHFYKRAQKIFNNHQHIHLLKGDSATVLPKLLRKIDQPVLFWLDAHYSGGNTAQSEKDTPIEAELKTIFSHPIKTHVILIDDARLFTGRDDYPTLDEIKKLATQHHFNTHISHDSIQLLPTR